MRGTAPSGGLFAPTLRYHEKTKTFYLITTWFDTISPPDVSLNFSVLLLVSRTYVNQIISHTPRSFYVTSKNIFDEKAWSDPIYVDQVGFDPDLFFDDVTGKTYLTTTAGAGDVVPDSGYFAIWISEIDIATGDALTASKVLHVSSLPLDTPRLAEGSHLFRKDGWIYLTTAEGGTDVQHRQMISRARDISGPWESNPRNPILYNGRDFSEQIQRTGHADFVTTPKGDWYAVFLGMRHVSDGRSSLGRETFLAPMRWENGWPVINNGNLITEYIPGLKNVTQPAVFRDEFKGKLADKEYYTARTPYKTFYSLTARPGYLTLRGNPYGLTDRETPAALFRKQTAVRQMFSTELVFRPETSAQEAGITIYLSIHFHNTIAIGINPGTGRPSIIARTRSNKTADVATKYEDLPADWNLNNPVFLSIRGTADKFELGYTLSRGGNIRWIASVESRWLQEAKEGWQVFTGSFWGVYSQGGGREAARRPAEFAWIETRDD